MTKITKGLDLPITGSPVQKIFPAHAVSKVAIVAEDYVGMKPSMLVAVGDKVKKGQPLFEDKKAPGVMFTSPVTGSVLEINRGDRRVFQSIVISNEGGEQVVFKNFKNKAIGEYSAEEVKSLLVESGFWTALRTRPFSKTPEVSSTPKAIFVNVMDTNPLAANPELVVVDHVEDLKNGVLALSKLTTGKVFVVTHKGSKVDVSGIANAQKETFEGPHPAGLVGTHIHFLSPVSAKSSVWHLNYQDVIAIGKLFKTGEFFNERVISLAGPAARNPRLVKTVMGASIADLVAGENFDNAPLRHVSGSVLGGRIAAGSAGFLGRFHLQVSMLKEGHHREFLGWHSPGLNKFSLKSVFLSKLIPGKKFSFDTNTNGSHRSIVPIGSFEAVMPMDILPTQLLRYMMSNNTDQAVNLGALELDEEDLALCTFVDPCKNEYGPVLRQNLNIIEKEG
ncbi:MAG: Na(+)-translocating NADH-quinone reductase subunit A [Bacteriovoracaceae bacterium]